MTNLDLAILLGSNVPIFIAVGRDEEAVACAVLAAHYARIVLDSLELERAA